MSLNNSALPKQMGREAKAVFITIMDMLNNSGEDHIKIDNNKKGSGLMPLSVEKINTVKFIGEMMPVYSFAHYYEQNGDLMRDPDVEFFVYDLRKSAIAGGITETDDLIDCVGIFPARFRQDGILFRDEQIIFTEGDKAGKYLRKAYHDTVNFCSMWMKNIKWQQELQINVKQAEGS